MIDKEPATAPKKTLPGSDIFDEEDIVSMPADRHNSRTFPVNIPEKFSENPKPA